jgi:hypothetical protein
MGDFRGTSEYVPGSGSGYCSQCNLFIVNKIFLIPSQREVFSVLFKIFGLFSNATAGARARPSDARRRR